MSTIILFFSFYFLRTHSPSVALRAPPPSRREAIKIAKAYARNDIWGESNDIRENDSSPSLRGVKRRGNPFSRRLRFEIATGEPSRREAIEIATLTLAMTYGRKQ